MKVKKLNILSFIFSPLVLFLILFFSGCESRYDKLDLSLYKYRDTRKLVKFVYNAYQILEKEGLASLNFFKDNRDRFQTEDMYLYIYDFDGNNLFHAGLKHLEGENLREVVDKDGKNIFSMIMQALADEDNPHSWVHFSWFEPGKFYPVPKSSCHFKVKTPAGREIFVGGGLDYPQEEQEFIRIVVDSAVELIKHKGRNAFPEIADPLSIYSYREVRVFAFGANDNILISPVLADSTLKIDLLDCSDEVGHKPFQKALENLERNDSTWEIFMAKTRYQRLPTKKCLYLRKLELPGGTIYVGAVTDLPQPPWTG